MAEMSENRQSIVKRLNRIEGQVKGVVRMLEEDRYCIDILHQIQAIKAALTKAETELLRAHAGECVDDALRQGTVQEKRKKIVELVDLFERVR
ncbi:MAG: metal-sensitive transcriptional regulator [Gammaproteobacteria bacterium]|nr:metal-sensitive transcriptional regulator [Gammaproteobacteria bacterium]